MPFDPSPEWFSVYGLLGGQKSAEEFAEATRVFIETAHGAYIDGRGDRAEAVERCMREMPCDFEEFTRIYNSIESVMPYS